MSRPWRVYYNIVFGGVGGLLAYLFVGTLPDFFPNNLFWELLIGAVAGTSIGAWLGMVDGALGKRIGNTLVGMMRGGALGFCGGILGLAFGELLFWFTQGGFIGRSMGWGLVGAIIGTTEGIANRAPRKISYGLIGGTLGGLIGGALFEGLTQIAISVTAGADPGRISQLQSIAAALGLVFVGMCIGSLIALVEQVLVGAWFKVVRGKQEGRDFNIIKARMTIGGDDSNDIPVYDNLVGKRAVNLRQRGKQIVIEDANGHASLIRPGARAPIPLTADTPLNDGDKIVIGNTLLLFRQRR
jgi:hypothetical protein